MMRTVDKALRLLNVFTIEVPEHGLSEVARLMRYDKATTLRLLAALEKHGFVEQHPETKKYRLGKSLLRYSRIREVSFPVAQVIQPILDRLAQATGETSHASLASGGSLVTIGVASPQRAMHVHVNASEALPYHASASGLVMLAYGSEELLKDVLSKGALKRYTPTTIVSGESLQRYLAEVRKRGFAVANKSFDEDVVGIASPIFDWSGKPYGAIAVASVAVRLNAERKRKITSAVIEAAVEATHAIGAESHPSLRARGKTLAA